MLSTLWTDRRLARFHSRLVSIQQLRHILETPLKMPKMLKGQ